MFIFFSYFLTKKFENPIIVLKIKNFLILQFSPVPQSQLNLLMRDFQIPKYEFLSLGQLERMAFPCQRQVVLRIQSLLGTLEPATKILRMLLERTAGQVRMTWQGH